MSAITLDDVIRTLRAPDVSRIDVGHSQLALSL